MTILEAALLYASKGMSVIPVKKDKRPLIKWEPYQKKRASADEIREWFKKFPDANIAIITGEISNLFVVDTDSQESNQRINEAIPDSLTVPCQHTPSGGMHFLFSHTPGFSNRAKVAHEIDIRTEGGYFVAAPSVNGNGKGWEWIVSPLDADVPELAVSVKDIIYKSFNSLLFIKGERDYAENLKSLNVTEVTNGHEFFMEGRRDEDLFRAANCLFRGGMDLQMVSKVLEILAKGCNPPFSDREAEEKVKSALDRSSRRKLSVSSDFRSWVEVTDGHFKVTNYHAESRMVTREDKHAVIQTIKRMQEEGLIEKVGKERGVYRKIENKIEKMQWMDIDETPIKINWPFNIQSLFSCYPKNVILIAGSPDAGKTAFCLDLCKRNIDHHEIHYFSSEMGPLELKVRTKKFDMPFEKWSKINFYERTHDLADVIQPDAVNIIDYLLVPEEAWKIALPIRQVFDKLDKGIAIIALQKPMTRDIARGGESTLDIPRLYLSMGSGVIKIVKCKNWANPERNPNGLSREFSIVQGARITTLSDWGISASEIRR